MTRTVCLIFLILQTVACQPEASNDLDADARARQLFGLPAPYHPDTSLAAKLPAMNRSQSLRREIGWQIVERIFGDTTIGEQSIPRWLTWYPGDEIVRLFASLWPILDFDQQELGAGISDKQIKFAAEAHRDYLWTLPFWSRERFDAWRSTFSLQAKLWGAAGLSRAMYNDTAAHHLLRQHRNLKICKTTPDNCQVDEFPVGSVIVKASWKRLRSGVGIKVYDTSPASLAAHLEKAEWQPNFEVSSEEAHGLKLTLGDSDFLLTGLHIMSKETKDWIWITLWWSPQASEEFREHSTLPLSLRPYYRMCLTTAFKDSAIALDVSEGPTLESLAAVYATTTDASWCSNPYIEEGFGNTRTNCIGCHQYAGSGKRSESILKLPGHGTDQTRERFPTDYVFGINAPPDNLALKFHQ